MSMKLGTISSMLTFLSIDSGMTKTIRQTLYQKPKLEEEKITLNMFYLKTSFEGGEGIFFASCWNYICQPCSQPACGSDCAC